MGSEELAANLFRITQTEAKLKSVLDKIATERKNFFNNKVDVYNKTFTLLLFFMCY